MDVEKKMEKNTRYRMCAGPKQYIYTLYKHGKTRDFKNLNYCKNTTTEYKKQTKQYVHVNDLKLYLDPNDIRGDFTNTRYVIIYVEGKLS